MQTSTMPRYAPVDGFGEYEHQQSTLPRYQTITPAVSGVLRGIGSPALGVLGALGQDEAEVPPPERTPPSAAGLVFGLGALALVGWLSYQAGRAMTPSGGDKKTWGWVGVPAGLLTGPVGLGIMGALANKKG